MDANREAVARDYRQYLDGRKAGEPRRFFGNRSHALYFLRAVAPTKMVDGAWLYGLLGQWRDPRFADLIRTYLEELGNGERTKNHVAIYGKLLRDHDCDDWRSLDDAFFNQGAIQLSLAYHAADFLPEIIGFNLGYEQLPLHLLITAHELAELDIDPYYFTLHVTVDNASTGHARRAVQAATDLMPRLGDAAAFHRRVALGYRLNDLPLGSSEAIAGFDLDAEVVRMLQAKAEVGAQMHSDYCRIDGRTVNEWLAAPEDTRAFLDALVARGWIRRGRPVQESRFWQLLQGDAAPMFGVFSAYEQQLLNDWIAGDAAAPKTRRFRPVPSGPPTEQTGSGPHDPDMQALRDRLVTATRRDEALDQLVPMMSPANHATPAGLAATRMFTGLLALRT